MSYLKVQGAKLKFKILYLNIVSNLDIRISDLKSEIASLCSPDCA